MLKIAVETQIYMAYKRADFGKEVMRTLGNDGAEVILSSAVNCYLERVDAADD